MRIRRASAGSNAFTIIEVILALGVIASCLLVIFGMIPNGLAAARESTLRLRGYQVAQYVQAAILPQDFAATTLDGNPLIMTTAGTYTFYTNADALYKDDLPEGEEFVTTARPEDDLKLVITVRPSSVALPDPVTGGTRTVVTDAALQLEIYEARGQEISASFAARKANFVTYRPEISSSSSNP